MDYQEAVDYLDSYEQFGINPGLKRIEAICRRLGNPQLGYEVIHVTGTNGKTSTCRMISSLLVELGYRTGLYTSPHLVSFTERIAINDRPVSEAVFAQRLSEIIPVIEQVKKEFYPDPLTEFEAITALGFYIFKKAKVDCAVIEVGMGGRWDATNIVMPKVAVITSVDLEHTDRLGTTKRKIAAEKAQIIKTQSKVVVGALAREAMAEVKKQCTVAGVLQTVFGTDFALLSHEPMELGQHISVKGLFDTYDFSMPLIGRHQSVNAALALASVEQFLGKPISQETVTRAFQMINSAGRLEILSRRPLVVLDGAHNPSGARALARSIKADFSYRKLHLILSILKDKDIDGILSELVPLASTVILTKNKSDRAESVDKLAQKVARFTANAVIEPEFDRAVKKAFGLAGEKDLVLITGSLYTVGEAKEILQGQQSDFN